MSLQKMTISNDGTQYTLHLTKRGALSELKLIELFTQVFDDVNPAAKVPKGQQSGASYQALYNQGPLLFREMAMDPVDGSSHSQLGGLVVTPPRLDATLRRLRQLGFEVE